MKMRRVLMILLVVGLLSLLGSSVALAGDGDVHLPLLSGGAEAPGPVAAAEEEAPQPPSAGESGPVFLPALTGGGTEAGPAIDPESSNLTIQVKNSDGGPLAGVVVSYNDYGSHYVTLGTSDAAGQVLASLPDGTYKLRAVKDHTQQVKDTVQVPGNAYFKTAKFTVHVKDSSGADFPGIAASFNDYGSHYLSMGNTDGNGRASIELFPGTHKFKATKDHTSANGDLTNDVAGTEQTIDFQTAKAIGTVKDCDGTPLAGFKVAFNDYGSHWLTMGTTGADGKASIELFPGERRIKASIDYTSETQTLNLSVPEGEVVFYPTRLNLATSATVKYNDYGSHWKTMTSPFYLFPGTYKFRFDGVELELPVSGCAMEKSVLIIRLKDSQGVGVPGGTAHLGVGGWPVIGTTDANGELVYFHNGSLGNMKIRMDAPFYGGTAESPGQDTTVNSVYDFQTQQVVIQLQDSAGTLTDGGLVQAGVGGWPVIGTTGDDGLGTLYHEHFAGTFKYRMTFNGTTEEQQHDVSTPFIFQTVQAVIQLIDHLGNPLNGGVVSFGIGGWPAIGTTGDGGSGQVAYQIFAGSYNFRMSYNFGTEEKNQDISTPVVFQTGLVSLQFSGSIQHKVGGWPAYVGPTEMLPINHGFGLVGCGYPRQEVWLTPTAGGVLEKSFVLASFRDSGGAGLAGGDFKYRFGWGAYTLMGTTGASGLIVYGIDGMHGNTKFNVSYLGASTEKEQNIAADSCVSFQTVRVTAGLQDSNAQPLGATFEYRYGWGAKAPFSSPTELLPVNTKITVYYGGASVEKEQNVGSAPNFVFNTVSVTAQLLSSLSADLTSGASFEYRYGWDAKAPFIGPKELLPVNTKITVYYGGTSIEKEQNVGSAPSFVFNTVSVTAELKDSGGNALGGASFEYRYGWGAKAAFSSPTELLPVNTKITVYYGGTSIEKEQNASTTPAFVFQTGKVTSDSGNCTDYRYGWGTYNTFTNGMELLPMNTKFRFNDGTPETEYSIVAATDNHIH